eukprot:g79365.t1
MSIFASTFASLFGPRPDPPPEDYDALPVDTFQRTLQATSSPNVMKLRDMNPAPTSQRFRGTIGRLDQMHEQALAIHEIFTDSENKTTSTRPFSIERFSQLSAGSCKVCFEGTYKVGKSTLMNMFLGQRIFLAHEVLNTTGFEIFLHGKNAFFDTEGFNQPLDVMEPYVRRDLIIAVLSEFCDVLAVVVDRLTVQDVELINLMIESFLLADKIDRLMVIHNVKTIRTSEGLQLHAQKVKASLENEGNYTILSESPLHFQQFLDERRSVNHYFMGDLAVVELWRDVIDQMAFNIISAKNTHRSFSRALRLQVPTLAGKYTTCRDAKVIIEGHCVKVDIGNARRIVLGKELVLRGRSRMSWLFCSNGRRLYVILGLPEFLLRDIQIIADSTINVRGVIRELSKETNGVCHYVMYSENVHLPCKIAALAYLEAKDAKQGETVEWSWARRGISKYGSTLVELRCNGLVNLEGLPSLNQALFKETEPDNVWMKIEHCVRATEETGADMKDHPAAAHSEQNPTEPGAIQLQAIHPGLESKEGASAHTLEETIVQEVSQVSAIRAFAASRAGISGVDPAATMTLPVTPNE